jgi:MOSC domain-containing protein YiiM
LRALPAVSAGRCRRVGAGFGGGLYEPLAGDQLYVDFDLSLANLPAGTRLAIGSAVIEVTPEPHTGCGKFVARFGLEAMKFVNSTIGRELNLRGINARVIQPGEIHVGDIIRKMPAGDGHLQRIYIR